MNIQESNRNQTQKKIQKALEKYNLQPVNDLNLEYIKPKYFNCQVVVNCKIYKKKKQYDLYKAL